MDNACSFDSSHSLFFISSLTFVNEDGSSQKYINNQIIPSLPLGSIVAEILISSSSTNLDGRVVEKAVVGTCAAGGIKLKLSSCGGITTESKKCFLVHVHFFVCYLSKQDRHYRIQRLSPNRNNSSNISHRLSKMG